MPSLTEILAPHDGSLAIVRELNNEWFVVLESGHLYRLPGADVAHALTARLKNREFGTIRMFGTEWRLGRAPVIKEHQWEWVERVLGNDGDRVIKQLLLASSTRRPR